MLVSHCGASVPLVPCNGKPTVVHAAKREGMNCMKSFMQDL